MDRIHRDSGQYGVLLMSRCVHCGYPKERHHEGYLHRLQPELCTRTWTFRPANFWKFHCASRSRLPYRRLESWPAKKAINRRTLNVEIVLLGQEVRFDYQVTNPTLQ